MIKLDGCFGLKRLYGFPSSKNDDKKYKYSAFIGVGSNIDEIKTLKLFMRKVLDDRRIKIISASPILINKAFGYTNQKDFSNGVLLIRTSLFAKELLKVLLHYESILKRKRSFKNAPRTLDLDILYFNNLCLKTKKLTLPHIGAKSRNSVLVPLGFLI